MSLKRVEDIQWKDIYNVWEHLLNKNRIDVRKLLEIRTFHFGRAIKNTVRYDALFWLEKEKIDKSVKFATEIKFRRILLV